MTQIIVVEYLHGRHWQLHKDLTCNTSMGIIVIPAGTTTDFASIPRTFWSIFPPFGRYIRAAILHDYCYQNGLFSRKIADRLFFEEMMKDGVAQWKSILMWKAVRLFGKQAYKNEQ